MKENKNNRYTELGYKNRSEYLQSLSEEYGVHIGAVLALADILGAEEDFDGLIAELEDYADITGDVYDGENDDDYDDDTDF